MNKENEKYEFLPIFVENLMKSEIKIVNKPNKNFELLKKIVINFNAILFFFILI